MSKNVEDFMTILAPFLTVAMQSIGRVNFEKDEVNGPEKDETIIEGEYEIVKEVKLLPNTQK